MRVDYEMQDIEKSEREAVAATLRLMQRIAIRGELRGLCSLGISIKWFSLEQQADWLLVSKGNPSFRIIA